MKTGRFIEKALLPLNSDTSSIKVVPVDTLFPAKNQSDMVKLAKTNDYVYVIGHGRAHAIEIRATASDDSQDAIYFDSRDGIWAEKEGHDLKEFDSIRNFSHFSDYVAEKHGTILQTYHCGEELVSARMIINDILERHKKHD